MLDKNGIELCAGDLAHVKRGSEWVRVWVRAVRVSPYSKKRPEALVDNGERWDVEAAGTATFMAWEDDPKKIAKFTRAIPAAPVTVADVIGGEVANAIRSVATIIGCPADTDPLTDLDGLVETVRVVTADRDRRIDPVEHGHAVHAAYLNGFGHGGGSDESAVYAWFDLSSDRDRLRIQVGADVLAAVEGEP